MLSVATLALAGCTTGQGAAGAKFEPAHPGVLTVATALIPAPGFWQSRRAGFEADLAAALAQRLGLRRIAVVRVPFARIVDGHLGGADMALSQLTPTAKREHSLDFTDAYLTSPPGILAQLGVEAVDVHGLQGLRWVASRTSTLTPILMHQVRPDDAPVMVEDRAEALRVLRAGDADALLLDLPVALGLARSEPRLFHVLGQLNGDEDLAAALPKGSSNLEIVDSSIRALIADGTVDRLASHWLGESQDDVPLILTEA